MVEIARSKDMINSIIGDGLLPHDRKIIVNMLPHVFSKNSTQIQTSLAREVLGEMGINLPAAVKDASTFDQLLKEIPDMSTDQILEFWQRTTGNQN